MLATATTTQTMTMKNKPWESEAAPPEVQQEDERGGGNDCTMGWESRCPEQLHLLLGSSIQEPNLYSPNKSQNPFKET